MDTQIENTPVEDTVPKINNEVAVGEDPEFQRRWWKFENAVWVVFSVLVLLDLSGAFGRGPLAKAHTGTSDGRVEVSYERIERTGTPSVLRLDFSKDAIHDNHVDLWASETLVTKLGNKQIGPQPSSSAMRDGGIQYTFQAASPPATAVFSLQPSAPGVYPLTLRVPGSPEVRVKILVVP